MATSKHFPVHKYGGSYDSDEDYRTSYKPQAKGKPKNGLPKDTAFVESSRSPSGYPDLDVNVYNSVTSFKTYQKSASFDDEDDDDFEHRAETNVVNGAPYLDSDVWKSKQDINQRCDPNGPPYLDYQDDCIDNTVTSAYDACKPPIPIRYRHTKQASIHRGARPKSECFSTDRPLDASHGVKRNSWNVEEFDKSVKNVCDSSTTNQYSEFNKANRRKSEPLIDIVKDGLKDVDSELQRSKDNTDSCKPRNSSKASTGEHLEETSTRPLSSSSRRRLPKLPDREGNGMAMAGIYKRQDREKNSEDFDRTVSKLSQIIENVKKNRNTGNSDLDKSNKSVFLSAQRSKLSKHTGRSKSIDSLDDVPSQTMEVEHHKGYLKEVKHKLQSKVVSRMTSLELDGGGRGGDTKTQEPRSSGDNGSIQNHVSDSLHVDESAKEYNENSHECYTSFPFDANIIQELTDSVMQAKENRNAPEKMKVREVNDTKHFDKTTQLVCVGNKRNEQHVDCDRLTFDCKERLEGKSFAGKENSEKPVVKSEVIGHDENKENEVKKSLPMVKVERTPSYRNRVIARAKNRYLKRSNMHKECSCTTNEKGERIRCAYCENYEKRRSKSSLGLNNVTEQGKSEGDVGYSDRLSPRRAFTPDDVSTLHHSQRTKSPQPVTKVQVSSRVDVLMSSDLFKKHLRKHEHLFNRHLRWGGIRKSVSNLDLTDGFKDDNSDMESVLSFATNVDKVEDFDVDRDDDIDDSFCGEIGNSVGDSLYDETGNSDRNVFPQDARRHSLCDVSSIPVDEIAKLSSADSGASTFPKNHVQGKKRLPIPSFLPSENSGNLLNSTNILGGSVGFCTDTLICDKEKDADSIRKLAGVKTIESRHSGGLDTIKETRSQESLNEFGENEDLSLTTATVDRKSIPSQEIINRKICNRSENIGVTSLCLNAGQDNSHGVTIEISQAPRQEDGDSVETGGKPDKLIRQTSSPSLRLKQRVRPKLKSRTLSRLDSEDSQCLSDGSEQNSAGLSVRERRRPGNKRPRSLISKKTSLASLIKESECRENNAQSDELDTSSERSISERPKLKVGHNVGRSKSDTKFETDRAKLNRQAVMNPPESIMKSSAGNNDRGRNSVSFDLEDVHQCSPFDNSTSEVFTTDKGRNSVSFDFEDVSQCSPLDIGESETSTSLAGSLSDSIRSEVSRNSILVKLLYRTLICCSLGTYNLKCISIKF